MKYGLSLSLPIMMLKRAPLAIPAKPSIVTIPVITGTPEYGQILTCSDGVWTGSPTYITFQWVQDGEMIPGATQSNYLLDVAQIGMMISCAVTAGNAGGETQELAAYVGPVTDVPP